MNDFNLGSDDTIMTFGGTDLHQFHKAAMKMINPAINGIIYSKSRAEFTL